VLEYRLEKFMEVDSDCLTFWHSGRATVGKGAVKDAQVVAFVRERCPELVTEGRIQLGRVALSRASNAASDSDWLFRFARYLLLRNSFKEAERARRAGV